MNTRQSTPKSLASLLLLLLVASAPRSAGAPPDQLPSPPPGKDTASEQTRLRFSDYRVLFDRNQDGYAASGGSFLYQNRKLSMAFQKASDGDSGTQTSLTVSQDLGKTWTTPTSFGPPVSDPKTAFQICHFAALTKRGTVIVSGSFNASGIQTSGEGINWRPNTALIGRRPKGMEEFSWARYPSGTFLGEQFLERGVVSQKGRIVLAVWGSARKGENWQCGVLLSDDEGKTWRYRQVGYAPDLTLRDRPAEPIGYNEQTLFETNDGTLVSIIRGRQKLAQFTDRSPRETYFSRSVSHDGGESWSPPELTNLAGTGASGTGVVLPDGSLLFAARIPHHVELTWIRPAPPNLYGLHLARSFDLGRTWTTERLVQQAPDGGLFDNYYNTMNGQFVQLRDNQWMYGFGQFDVKRKLHRMLAFTLTWN